MIKTVLFYTAIILSLIVTSPALLIVWIYDIRNKTEKRKEFVHKFTLGWAKFIMKISGSKLIVHGAENIPKNETVLFIGNHQSNFDIPILLSSVDMPKGFIAKKELESWPIISTWMKKINCIFMDRDNLRKSAEAIVQGINILKSGYSMVIFPEGTRGKNGQMLKFKAGSFKLATKSKVKIIPVSIDGSYKLLEETGRLKPQEINVYFHEPINTTSLSKEEIEALPEKVQEIVQSKLSN